MPHFTPINPDILLRPCDPDDFWGTPPGAEYDPKMIFKFREGEKEILNNLPKWDWNDIFIYADEEGVSDLIDSL